MTIGSEALGSFATASTNRLVVIGGLGAIASDGEAGAAVSGQLLAAVDGPVSATGQSGQPVAGQALTALYGAVGASGQAGQAVSGQALTGVTGAIAISGYGGVVVSGQSLTAVSSSLAVAGGAGTAVLGVSLTATVSSVTVTGFEGVIVYAISTTPAQTQYFDLVNQALNDVFGQPVYYVKDGVKYTTEGHFTDQTQYVGFDGQIATTEPMVTIRREDMPYGNSPINGEVLSVAGRTWVVWDWRVDDSDAYTIILKANR